MKNRAVILLLAIVLAGCGPRLVYPHLDWLIPWYVSDYISLDSDPEKYARKAVVEACGPTESVADGETTVLFAGSD